MKQLPELKKALREAGNRIDAYFTTERLKDDFFNKLLQEKETSLYVYDIETFPENEEKVPVSIVDAFTKIRTRLIWDYGEYNSAMVLVEIAEFSEAGVQLVKCKADLIYNHEMELTDADYYKVSAG